MCGEAPSRRHTKSGRDSSTCSRLCLKGELQQEVDRLYRIKAPLMKDCSQGIFLNKAVWFGMTNIKHILTQHPNLFYIYIAIMKRYNFMHGVGLPAAV